MNEKQIKLPGPDHPISIQRNPARVIVSVAGRVVADTRNALTLREAQRMSSFPQTAKPYFLVNSI